MKTIQDAPSWPVALTAREAHVAAVTQFGAQSEQAQATARARLAAELKCAQEVGIQLPTALTRYL